MFVGTLGTMPVGTRVTVRNPRGQAINIIRIAAEPDQPEQGFQALSSRCPHLGCQVHWDAGLDRFICPCHNGVFTKDGIARQGPPAREGKNLTAYEVKVNPKTGWVFVLVHEGSSYGV